ncbi:MAG: hypothetical protein K2Q22_11770, partial [Cytophagales bacterium]|nr:hypothetical protein [Cytophagales bacterium]
SANTGTLTLAGFAGNVLRWQSSTDNFATVSNISSITSSLVFNNLATTTSFRAIVQNGVCSTVASSAFTVTVNGISVGGTVSGPNLAQCASANVGTLTLAGFSGNIQGWQSSTDNFATVTNISSTTSSIVFNNLATTTSFRAIVQNGVCSTVASSAFTVTVNGISLGGTVTGPNTSQCSGANSGTLTVAGFSGNIIQWQSSIDNFATSNSIASTTSNIIFSNLTTNTSFRAIVQNGVCSTVSSFAFTVTVNGISLGGTVAGLNSALCAGGNSGTLTLSGFSGNIQNWQSSTNNFATITNISSTTSSFVFNNLTTTTSFRAIIQNGACSTVTSSAFTVTINGISVGGTVSGPNVSQCAGANSGTLTVAGFSGNILQWQSSIDNFASFNIISSTTSNLVFNNLVTTTSFRAIVQNGVCSTVSSSAFTVTVNGVSIGGTISGPSTSVCSGVNNGTLTLSGFVGNIVRWQSSTDNFTTITNVASTTSAFTFVNLSSTTSFRAIVQNGLCSTVTSNSFTVSVDGISLGGTTNSASVTYCASSNSG